MGQNEIILGFRVPTKMLQCKVPTIMRAWGEGVRHGARQGVRQGVRQGARQGQDRGQDGVK